MEYLIGSITGVLVSLSLLNLGYKYLNNKKDKEYKKLFQIENLFLKKFNEKYNRDPSMDETSNILKEIKSKKIKVEHWDVVFAKYYVSDEEMKRRYSWV